MRYLISIVYLIFCISNTMQAQQKFDFDSTKIICKDKGIFQSSRLIKIDKNNNKYLSGTFKGNLLLDTFSISTLDVITNNNFELAQGIFIAKYDSNNNLLWFKKFAEADTLYSMNFQIDNSNNLIINYLFYSKLYHNNDSIESNGSLCINIFKYDFNGDLIFKKVFSGNGNEAISEKGISIDNNNNIIACVNFGIVNNSYTLAFDSDTFVANSIDPLILKLDSLGNYLKAYQYSSNSINGFYNIYFENEFIYLIGTTSMQNIQIGNINIYFPNNYDDKNFIAKLDKFGDCKWARKFGRKYNNALGTIVSISLVIKNDKVYFTANGNDQNQLEFLFDGGPNLLGIAGASNFESFVACYDTAGNFKWRKLVPDVTYPSQLTVDSNSNVIGIGGNDFTLKVFSYDSTGAFNWQAVSDADNLCTTVGSGITQDTHGKLYIVGGTTCNPLYMGNDTLHPPVGQSTLFYASLDSINAQWAVNTQDINPSSKSIRIYPNPANNLLVLENIDANVATKTITISNLQAQVVYKTTTTENKININTSTLPNGVYSIQYKTNKEFVTQKIIIQH